MKAAKIFKVFKKGAKAAGKRKGKKPAEAVRWPGGTRIGVFGHTNSGKTVYFTVLNEDCKISKRLQISVTDTATAGEFLGNYRSIWGLGSSDEAGTVVDFRGEKKFPKATKGDKILKFNAIVDRSKKIPVVAYDYSGEAVSISAQGDEVEKVADFMVGCDGILFFFDPKMLGAELESQARVAAFVNILEQLAPLRSRLPIPMAVVVTKSDILPGFDEKYVTLIGPEDEYLAAEDFESVLEKILINKKIAANPNWSGSVRNVLVRLKDFLRVVLRRTLDFQVFFISATGREPEKIGTEVGRSIYAPPEKMQPVGVKEPFYWLLKSIIRNKRISRMRSMAKYVAVASIIWMILFSIPFLFHFKVLYPKPARVEETVKEAHGGSLIGATGEERTQIMRAYNGYSQAKTVNWFFGEFKGPARRISDSYRSDQLQKALRELNEHIGLFATTVASESLWPAMKLTDSSVTPDEEHQKFLSVFDKYHQTDSTSGLFLKSGHALEYWNLFVMGVKNRKDEEIWGDIQNQVKQDSMRYWGDWSKEEQDLARALAVVKVKKEQQKEVETATVQFDEIMATINSNSDPDYRLKEAVDTLRKIKSKVDDTSLGKINKYISSANEWKNLRRYVYTVASIPADWHLHIAVAEKGQDPSWKRGEQIGLLVGRDESLEWKAGDVIYIAIDSIHVGDDSWGANPRGKKILRGDFSVFEMDGDIKFDDTGGKTVSIQFKPSLRDRLPELK